MVRAFPGFYCIYLSIYLSICIYSALRRDNFSSCLYLSCHESACGNDGPDRRARADLTLLPLRAVRGGGVAIPCGFRTDHLLRRQGSRLDARAHPLDRQRDAQAAPARSKWPLGSACAQLLCLLGVRLTALGDSALPGRGAGPLGAQPLPGVLEPAASNVRPGRSTPTRRPSARCASRAPARVASTPSSPRRRC